MEAIASLIFSSSKAAGSMVARSMVARSIMALPLLLLLHGPAFAQSTFDSMMYLHQFNQSYCTGSGGEWTGMMCEGGTQKPRQMTPEERKALQESLHKLWDKFEKDSACLLILYKPGDLKTTQKVVKFFNERNQQPEIYLDITDGTYVATFGIATPGYGNWPSMGQMKMRQIIPRGAYCMPRREAARRYVKPG